MSSHFYALFLCFLFVLGCQSSEPGTSDRAQMPALLKTDAWTYVEIDSAKAMWGDFDEPDWLRYFGLAAGDLNGDDYLDLVSGRTVYLNPGADMSGRWEQVDLGRNVDANLIYQPPTGQPCILGEALPDVLAFRSYGDGTFSAGKVVAQVPPTGHHNGQGYRVADIDPTSAGNEILYASQGGIYIISYNPRGDWSVMLAGKDASDEGFDVVDMDGDGNLDLVAGYRLPGGDAEVPTALVWFENPRGGLTADWEVHRIGETSYAIDRVEAGDLDGDGRPDVVVGEERYPGLEPDATLWQFLQRDTGWVRNAVVTQFSMNNLDLADIDSDGDTDIITAEHKGADLSLQVWLNDGAAAFTQQEIDRGKESHLGAQACDMDNDGDLDLISIGWDRHGYVHLWRNDALKK